jgi:hypothetical protein
MKGPRVTEGGANSASLAIPAIVVILVLVLGATIYLWRAGYIRRKTAYATMLVLVVALAGFAMWMYWYPMQDLGG